MEQLTLKVSGMTCGGCVRSVKNVLEAQRGVQSAEVSLDNGEARVRYDPSLASVQQLQCAVEDAGYQARPA
ncbi:MAG TPA: heavy metal-associated domain-containing protein [Burkholderiales bacterium]|nr:heavy metal-associated domain-containing protein [Burkholderiales bacterium]